MKAMKLALIGTAALAAVSVSARADDLNALKAQIETLNARVASLEATPSVPAGYQAVSFTRNEAGEHVISIMPTADAPAAATIVWSGWVRAGIVAGRNVGDYMSASSWHPVGSSTNANYYAGNEYAADIRAAAGLKVVATTDTAVGEVGVSVAMKATGSSDIFANGSNSSWTNNGGNPAFVSDGFYGWWKMTPNLTLKGGVFGSLSKNGYSFDAQCTCAYNDYIGAVSKGSRSSDPAQVQIAYADGPLGIAIAVEDGDNDSVNASAFGVTGKATYKGDTFGADLSGGYWGTTDTTSAEASWVIDGGIGAKLGMFSVGAALGMGSGFKTTDDFTKVSAYAMAALSDSAGIELGVGHVWNTQQTNTDRTVFDAALYYTPVKQLTVGLEGSYVSGGQFDGTYVAALYTTFKF
ncbi:hypothetical protein [Aestuariivirga litoralis]|uniref:hypothetical protein n=1 Tax=Aestuariivirga litoralis TaxID=2650924 RepID=UPI0018C7E45F|nr:hypothetical protein [Aestuariivirga litoralis]MBG1231674.1 hypothetical protein [Aestuariivirga litoralis]